ncbi:hypothetical protein SGR_3309 [Streptomyces griseus subsp. griseus NBRC 13350]|uniref:Uncharacterized protein n=1 Tax=Streptomyces griseus subsp. griseus (strain JCM 4626 / CBS 651.72 / NBRC 13350 / KCC S-0626 / ISP 5235) TaxID=455632 RepID=B1VM28_STRGG|nr:hypothetical protein SGR_3309 [Streptomyces griseus subsp. griseus NBRC 13350]
MLTEGWRRSGWLSPRPASAPCSPWCSPWDRPWLPVTGRVGPRIWRPSRPRTGRWKGRWPRAGRPGEWPWRRGPCSFAAWCEGRSPM